MNSHKTQKLTLESGVESLVGRLRESNEDSYAVFAPAEDDDHRRGLDGLLLVADGMGGELAGDVASRLATEAIRTWSQQLEGLHLERTSEDAVTHAAESLRTAFAIANAAVCRYGRENQQAAGLGTTLVVAALVGPSTIVAHIGDSRCYRVRNRQVEQLTVDHSWVEQQAQAGLVEREGIESHPQSNVLTRSIGSESNDEADIRVDASMPGDLLILCSDGLTGSVREADLLEASELSTPQDIASHLARLANDRDGSDNITVAVGRLLHRDDSPNLLPTGTSSSRSRVVARATAGALAMLALGFAGGTYRSQLIAPSPAAGIEEQAKALLEVATVDLENGRPLDAQEHLAQARALFQEAPQAREAQRRLSELSRRPSPQPSANTVITPVINMSPTETTADDSNGIGPIATEDNQPADPPDTSTTADVPVVPAAEGTSPETGDASPPATPDPSDAALAEAKAAKNSGSGSH